jgi:hypothetical protein
MINMLCGDPSSMMFRARYSIPAKALFGMLVISLRRDPSVRWPDLYARIKSRADLSHCDLLDLGLDHEGVKLVHMGHLADLEVHLRLRRAVGIGRRPTDPDHLLF